MHQEARYACMRASTHKCYAIACLYKWDAYFESMHAGAGLVHVIHAHMHAYMTVMHTYKTTPRVIRRLGGEGGWGELDPNRIHNLFIHEPILADMTEASSEITVQSSAWWRHREIPLSILGAAV